MEGLTGRTGRKQRNQLGGPSLASSSNKKAKTEGFVNRGRVDSAGRRCEECGVKIGDESGESKHRL